MYVSGSEGYLFGFASEDMCTLISSSVLSAGVEDDVGIVVVVPVVSSFRISLTQVRIQSLLTNSEERHRLSQTKFNHLSKHIPSKIIIASFRMNILTIAN